MGIFKDNLSFSFSSKRFVINDHINIINLCKFIIRYPLIWYYYTKEIIEKNLVYLSEFNSLIIPYRQLNNRLKQTVDKIVSFLQQNHALKKQIIEKDIMIIYLQDKEISEALSNNRVWLRYVTLYALTNIIKSDIFVEPVLILNYPNQQYDLLFSYNNMNYVIMCEYPKNIVWHHFVKNNIFLIFVTLKDIDDNLPIIKYKYNFEQFKNDLVNVLVKLDTIEMFYF